MAAASLAVRVSAQIAEFQKSFQDASKTLDKFAGDFEGIATRASAVGTFFGNIATDIARSLARGLGSAISDAVKFSSQFNNAFIGLSSVARAFGTNTDLATAAARRLSADGLLPLKDSATGLKNLLASGFNLEQSTKLMNAFKDSAAFGRVSAISFGDAIRDATAGVKNGNSILVDNVGITKNLSQILKEAGFSAQDLSRATSDAGVRMALYNGILKESAAFTGDANRLTQTYQGTLDGMRTSWTNLLATWGDAITKNKSVAEALGFVRDAFTRLNGFLSDNRRGFLFVSDAIILFVSTLAGTVRAINAVQGAFNALDSIVIGVTRGFLQSVKFISDSLLDLVRIASKVPGSTILMSGMADEIGTLAIVSLKAGKAVDTFADRIAENDRRSKRWNDTLGGVANELDGLVTHLKETRGQTVELGDVADATGRSLETGLGGGAEKAGKKVKALKADVISMGKVIAGIPAGMLQALNKPVPPPIFAQAPDVRLGGIPMGAFGLPVPLSIPQAAVSPFRDAFAKFGQELPDLMFGALMRGGIGEMFGTLLVGLGQQFSRTFETAVARVRRNTEAGIADSLSTGERAIGTIGVGIQSGLQGFQLGQQLGPKKGALAGGASGALAGLPLAGVTGGLSVLVGFGAGAIGGWLGGRKRDKEALAAMKQQQAQLIRTAGSVEALERQFDQLGISIGHTLSTNDPDEFALAMRGLDNAVAAQKKRWEGLQLAIEGVNRKAELFAAPFRTLIASKNDAGAALDTIKNKLSETAQRGQAEFERLGIFVGATFAGLVRENGDGIAAVKALGSAFKVLKEGVKDFGLTSTAVIDQLIHVFDLITDDVTGPILDNIQATGQIFTGLSQAGLITKAIFQAVGTDIGASFRELEAKGGDVAAAMALSQPILQRLWEAQRLYGTITDETTQAILHQAEEQGLVGAHMQDVNRQILDVLIAIADVFGATLPEAFRRTGDAADRAGRDIVARWKDIHLPDLEVNVHLNVDEIPNFDAPVAPFAKGGIVRRPTLALIGEAGPEAVIPLSGRHIGLDGLSPLGSQPTVVNKYYVSAIDAQDVARFFARREADEAIERKIKQPGNVQTAVRQVAETA